MIKIDKRFSSVRKAGFSIRKNIFALTLTTAITIASPFIDLGQEATAHASAIVGTSAAVKGNVFVKTSGAERKTQVNDQIKLDDEVTTKLDSALQILLLDQSTFTVGQNCKMIIDRFVYDPSTSSGKIGAQVTKGAFRFMSGNIGKNNPTNASVRTPTATIGIRGTFFEGIVGKDAIALAQLGGLPTAGANPAGASIIILRGPGAKSNTLDKRGQITISTSGGKTSVSTSNYAVFDPGNGEPPSAPFKVTPEMQSYLDFFLRSSPKGPSENPLGVGEDASALAGQDLFEIPQPTNDGQFENLVDGIQEELAKDYCDDGYSGGFPGYGYGYPSGC